MAKSSVSTVMDMRFPAYYAPIQSTAINFAITLIPKISLLRMSTIGIRNKMGLLRKKKFTSKHYDMEYRVTVMQSSLAFFGSLCLNRKKFNTFVN